MKFTNVNRPFEKLSDGTKEIAVTPIDYMFSDTDAFIKTNGNVGGNMNKCGLWDDVIQKLEGSCINRYERLDKNKERMEIIYSIPITGYQIIPVQVPNEDYFLGSYHACPRSSSESSSATSVKKAVLRKVKQNPAQVIAW